MTEVGERNDAVKFGQTTGTPGHDHPAYLTQVKVLGTPPITITPNEDGTITISGGSVVHTHDEYVRDTGDTITGIIYIDAGADVPLRLMRDGTTGWCAEAFYKDGKMRWLIGVNGDAEGGGNDGSNFVIRRQDDDGATLGYPMTFYRRSGLIGVKPTETFGTVEHALNDTGWRVCTNKLQNGWTASGIGLRRVGDQCFMRINGLSASDRTASNFYSLKTGWVPGPQPAAGVICTAASAGGMARQVISSGSWMQVVNSQTSDQSFTGTVVWFTDDAYPTATPES